MWPKTLQTYKWFIFLICFSAYVNAEWTLRGDVLASMEGQRLRQRSPINTNNLILGIPENTQQLEIRPDLSYLFLEEHSLTLRTRHFFKLQQINFFEAAPYKEENRSNTDISDFYVSSNVSGFLNTAIGLQNYQWGPAEIFSPSNPYYHFNSSQRSFFYKEKGQVLIRLNWNPNPETNKQSVVLIHQPTSNNETHWMADQKFSEKSVLKFEMQMENPSNVLAFMVGRLDDKKSFIGEYLNWSPNDTWSFYVDIQHKEGKNYYQPIANGFGGYDMSRVEPDTKNLSTFSVLGLRWEGAVDFRQELIINESGWSDSEWKKSLMSATTPGPLVMQNLKRFSKPGLEFRTKSYSYTSLRVSDLGETGDSSFAIRILSSLTQSSSATQLNWEHNANDRTVLSAEALVFLGDKNTEFTLLSEAQLSLGFRWSW